MTRPLGFIAHPVRGDIEANLASVKRIYRELTLGIPEADFVVPWVLDVEVFDDSDDAQRMAGIERNLRHVGQCDFLVACGERITEGMIWEIAHAMGRGVPWCNVTGRANWVKAVRDWLKYREIVLKCREIVL